MPTIRFSSGKDARFFKKRSAEQARLYYPPLRWLVNNDTITLNLYGEPGNPISGIDGVSSDSVTQQFSSASVDFVDAGVGPGDILEIQTPACNDGDNGRYQISSVIDTNTLDIGEDWPLGELSALVYNVHFLKERYTEHPQLIPFLVKLRPTEKELTRWGIGEKRDAMIVLSIQLCDEIGLIPKIGDRFLYPYQRSGRPRTIHMEVKNLYEETQLSNSAVPIHYVGFAMRTTNKLP